jgi:PAS domain S-box-containing protein
MLKIRKKILIVEDDFHFGNSIKLLLEDSEYETALINKGNEAIEYIDKNNNVNLILMDIELGDGIDGVETAKLILKKYDIPIIFLTGYKDEKILKSVEKIPSYGYIIKGTPVSIVLTTIKMALELYESKQQITESVFNNSINGICIHRMLYDETGKAFDCEYVKFNKAYERIFGFSKEKISGKTIQDLFSKDEADLIINIYNEVVLQKNSRTQELFIKSLNKWLNLSIFYIHSNHKFAVSINDITKSKKLEQKTLQQNEQLKAANTEKTVLLKEIHHRVKNNLQIVQSILNMQKDYTDSESTKALLNVCIDRIHSMASIHESLYQTENLANIDMKEYIKNLSSYLHYSYSVDECKIHFYIDTDDIYLDIEKAVPIGLLLNEIITNCLKHAFKGRHEGKINISFKSINDRYELIIKDDGIGLPENVKVSNNITEEFKSYGIKLISIFSGQLRAKIDIIRANGTKFVLIFDK